MDRKLIAQKGLSLDTVAEAARTMLVAEPAVAAAYTRRELETGSRAGAPFFDQMRKSWNKEISGDVQYALKPGWMATSSSAITTHGSPHPYDTHVPILVYGPEMGEARARGQPRRGRRHRAYAVALAGGSGAVVERRQAAASRRALGVSAAEAFVLSTGP